MLPSKCGVKSPKSASEASHHADNKPVLKTATHKKQEEENSRLTAFNKEHSPATLLCR